MIIPAGTWKARGCEAALGMTSGGKEQIGVDLVILEGEAEGAHITWYGYFTDTTFERTIESLRLLGWEGDDLSDLRGINKNEVALVVDHEEFEGRVRVRANWINPIGGVVLKDKMTDADAKGFAARMKGQILALGRSGGGNARSAPRAGGAPTGQGTDDIPF